MLALHGTGIGRSVVTGRAFVWHRAGIEIPEYVLPRDRIEEEVRRFRHALDTARDQLGRIRGRIPPSAPSEILTLIDAHLLMLDDPMLAEAPVETIRTEQRNAEWALQIHSERLMTVFENMEDPYLRAKKTDIQQVVTRAQRHLLMLQDEEQDDMLDGLEGRIVVSHDLTPADTVLLKHHGMAAFVTNLGGPISHAAILARSLGLSAIVGLHGAIRYIRHDEEIIVDGQRGVVIVGPDEPILRQYREIEREIHRARRQLDSLRTAAAVTRDGEKVSLLANIELPEDLEAVERAGANGIGLYRTEYLYMNREQPPSEEEQFAAYARVVKTLRKPVAIRTLDLGADKQVDGRRNPHHPAVTNPALGMRAVRLCLHDTSIFRPQLRAILRASALGPVQIMIPMVSNLNELDQVLDLIREIKGELRREGHPYSDDVAVGGMIEVPAAAVAADLFAHRLDFLSIGTNDLIQYTLAIDRVDDEVNYLYDPLHPSVLRLIQRVIEAGDEAGIPVSMCGEMAGDVTYTRLLLALGLRVFSMDAASLLEVKGIIRDCDVTALRAQTQELLRSHDVTALRDFVERINEAGAG